MDLTYLSNNTGGEETCPLINKRKDEESALKRLCDDFDLVPTDEGFDADAFSSADLLEVVEVKKNKNK
jgi:hypothetical protein